MSCLVITDYYYFIDVHIKLYIEIICTELLNIAFWKMSICY